MAAIKKLNNTVTPLASSAGESQFTCRVDLNFGTNGILRPNYDAQGKVEPRGGKDSRY